MDRLFLWDPAQDYTLFELSITVSDEVDRIPDIANCAHQQPQNLVCLASVVALLA